MLDRSLYPRMVFTPAKGVSKDSQPRDNVPHTPKTNETKTHEAKRRENVTQESDSENVHANKSNDENELSPQTPKTGRIGDSEDANTSESKPETVGGQEVAEKPPEESSANCHHRAADAADSVGAADLSDEMLPEDDVSLDERTDWDEVLAFVADAAAAEARQETVTAAVTAPDATESATWRSTQKLSESEEDRFLMLLSYGASLRQAAAAVGCHHTTFVRRAKRDKKLAQAIRSAKMQARSEPLLQIYQASRKSWRAAAWLVNHLERRENRGRRK